MTADTRPAAYLRITDPTGRQALLEAARQRGWPHPAVGTETVQDGPGSRAALDRLIESVLEEFGEYSRLGHTRKYYQVESNGLALQVAYCVEAILHAAG